MTDGRCVWLADGAQMCVNRQWSADSCDSSMSVACWHFNGTRRKRCLVIEANEWARTEWGSAAILLKFPDGCARACSMTQWLQSMALISATFLGCWHQQRHRGAYYSMKPRLRETSTTSQCLCSGLTFSMGGAKQFTSASRSRVGR